MLTYIYGMNDVAKFLCYHLKKEQDIKLTGFIVSPEYISSSKKDFCDLPVFSLDDVKNIASPSDINVYICIGYREMNSIRMEVHDKCKNIGFSMLNYIHPSAFVGASDIGEGNIILPNVIIGEYTIIGNCNIFGHGSLVGHDSSIGSFNYFAGRSCLGGNVKVGSRCFLGLNSTINDGVKIGDKALVGATAFVNKDVETGKVILPARAQRVNLNSEAVIKLCH